MTPESTADPEALPYLRPTPIDRQLQALAARDAAESKNLKTAVVAASLFHILLLAITFPELLAKPDDSVQGPHKAFVIQQVRFKPPAPRREQEVPKRREKRIPIPDPTPEDPEPILIEDLPLPDMELPETDAEVFGIPDAPPAETFGDGEVMQVGGGVTAPEKILAPQPRYSEEARKGRIQGTVILQAIIIRE